MMTHHAMQNNSSLQIASIEDLIQAVCAGNYGIPPEGLRAVGASWIYQTTQFAETSPTYQNHYLLLRVGPAFGACAHTSEQLDSQIAFDASGCNLRDLLEDPRLPVRIAALDAYFANLYPHRMARDVQITRLPAGTPIERARARDAAIVRMLDIQAGQRVALIGVVNPLVDAILARGAECLPCDLTLETTQAGIPVERDMERVLALADVVVSTAMTLSNGSFDRLIARVRERQIPLLVYAQTGSAIVPRFLGQGVHAVVAEPFPFSQFSGDPSDIYCYRSQEN